MLNLIILKLLPFFLFLLSYYRRQMKFGKVMFSLVLVCMRLCVCVSKIAQKVTNGFQ